MPGDARVWQGRVLAGAVSQGHPRVPTRGWVARLLSLSRAGSSVPLAERGPRRSVLAVVVPAFVEAASVCRPLLVSLRLFHQYLLFVTKPGASEDALGLSGPRLETAFAMLDLGTKGPGRHLWLGSRLLHPVLSVALADCTSDNSPLVLGAPGVFHLHSKQELTDSLSLRVAGRGLWERILTVCAVPMPSSCRSASASTCRAGSLLVGESWVSRVSLAGVLLPLGSGWNPARPRCPVPFLSV